MKTWSQYSSTWEKIKRFVEPWFSVIALVENTSVFFGHLEGDVRDRKRIKTKGLAEEDSLREKIEIKKSDLDQKNGLQFLGTKKGKKSGAKNQKELCDLRLIRIVYKFIFELTGEFLASEEEFGRLLMQKQGPCVQKLDWSMIDSLYIFRQSKSTKVSITIVKGF